ATQATVVQISVWRQPEFLKLWVGQTVSLLGSQVTQLALALTAALVLRATPAEMGLLGTLNVLPLVVFGLPAGVWVDRARRRPLLICADLGRAILLASVPLAAAADRLSIPHLYVVSFGLGTLNAVFAVAYGSFLPSVVSRGDLAEGNAKLALAEALARVTGPGIGGALVQLLTAPLAILVDCISFLISALAFAVMHSHEPPPQASHRKLGAEMAEGLRAVFGHRLLRPLFIGSNFGVLADGLVFQSGVVVLFMTRELRLEPAAVGGVFAGLGIGGLLGAAAAGPATRLFGVGATILGCLGLWAVGYGGLALVPESPAAPAVVAALLGAVGAINPVAGANISTVRQSVTPDRLLGRVTSVVRVGAFAALMAGSLAGGILAETLGLRATLILGGLLPVIGGVILLFSPIRRLRGFGTLQPAA
ncbi:MAG TPA: MFS transporter, partial [Chloroflexota bacterium]|nr:MFS transporter [Chloroflexota bacterium]